MKSIKSLLIAVACFASATTFAQELKSGYFSDNYLYRHNLNPAFGNENGYVSMPFLGNLNVGIGGNISLNKILYNRNGQTVTFMHPDVSKSEVLSNIKENTKLTEQFKLQILSIGFKGMGGYNTLDLNIRENLGVAIPGSMFHMLKEGITNKTYDYSNLGAHADAYAEIGLGHSHAINDNLRIGAKAKILLGIGNVDMKTNSAKITLNEDGYDAELDAEANINVKGITFNHDEGTNEVTGVDDIDGMGLGGFGMAFDLGAEYKVNNFTFSAAIIDLGFIKWNTNHVLSTNGLKKFHSNDYQFTIDGDYENQGGNDKTYTFDDGFEKMGDDIAELIKFDDNGDLGSQSRSIGATLNIGADWRVKWGKNSSKYLSLGILNTTRIQGTYSWTDFRFMATVHPLSALTASANLSAGTYGVGFGWMLNLQAPKGIGLFVGMDHTSCSLSKQGIPLNSNIQFSMGLNFPF